MSDTVSREIRSVPVDVRAVRIIEGWENGKEMRAEFPILVRATSNNVGLGLFIAVFLMSLGYFVPKGAWGSGLSAGLIFRNEIEIVVSWFLIVISIGITILSLVKIVTVAQKKVLLNIDYDGFVDLTTINKKILWSDVDSYWMFEGRSGWLSCFLTLKSSVDGCIPFSIQYFPWNFSFGRKIAKKLNISFVGYDVNDYILKQLISGLIERNKIPI